MQNKKGNVAVITIIVVIVAITAGVVGWLLAKNSQAPVSQQVTIQQPATSAPITQTQPVTTQQPAHAPQTASDNEQISSITKSFYDTYFGILAKADAQYAQTKKPVQFGDQIKQQEVNYVTANFFANTDNKTPLACTTDWENYNVKNYAQPVVSNNTATQAVTFGYGNESTIYATATLSLTKSSGTWKIDNIACKIAK